MKNLALTCFQRKNNQPPFFSKFYSIYNQERKHLKPLSGNVYNFSIKQVHLYDKEQNNNIYLCLTMNSDQFINYRGNNFIYQIHERLELRYDLFVHL